MPLSFAIGARYRQTLTMESLIFTTRSFRCCLICILLAITALSAHGQLLDKLGKKVERKVKQRIEQKTDRAIDKGLDKAEEALSKPSKTRPTETQPGEGQPSTVTTAPPVGPFSIESDFDFTSGKKLIFYDDFSEDALGDFPAKWNTNGSGEVVTVDGLEGKWLRIPDNTLSFAEIGAALPDNFTVEFDLYYPKGVSRPPITFGFTDAKNPATESIRHKKLFYYRISPSVDDQLGYSTSLYSGREVNKEWPANAYAGKPVRVSIAVNGQRIRLYMDQAKLFDLPRAFEPANLRSNFHLRAAELLPAPQDGFYIANLRIAETGLDARSQLLKNGRFSTTGIYFNTNSSAIKAESAGVLQEIAAILNDNPTLGITIIGHTDSDGEDAHNLQLSKARAANVKTVLCEHYGVAPDRLKTDGKGEQDPVADNGTPAGKAENRRVEFIKH